jgi:2,3-bisphosphoglycerate-dependent phosphoglycerate mutase
MTETGRQQAVRAGQTLRQKQFKFDQAFTTGFIRAQESLASVFEGFQERVPTIEAEELNTRTFGQLERLTIKQAAEKYSPQQVRWWYGTDFTNVPDNAPPGGETLRDCDTRAKSYYDKEIKPLVQAGKNILVVAHRNPIMCVSLIPQRHSHPNSFTSLLSLISFSSILFIFS